ncbi:Calx-beta domain-containing protein [Kordiimonas sp.]|uniref:Calx-beta domain-containing protein n=1 Tax=Kordiimonas sp. TaxID=1970157 RepID=UPI003A8D2BAF
MSATFARADPQDDISYEYDTLGRLVRETHGFDKTYSYTYDAAGNRTKHIVEGSLPLVRLWRTAGLEATGVPERNNGRMYFTVWRVGASNQDLTVQYETFECTPNEANAGHCSMDNLAEPGVDYTPTTGSVTIPASNTDGVGVTFVVQTLPDDRVEDDKYLYVRLKEQGLVGARLDPEKRHAPGRLRDIDGDTVRFQVSSASREEGTALLFNVRKIGNAKAPYTVKIRTTAGTAIPGEDYVSIDQELTFPANGEGSAANAVEQLVKVETLPDRVYEGAEQFGIELYEPSSGAVLELDGTIDRSKGIGTIQDAGDLPMLSLGNDGMYEGDSGESWGVPSYWFSNAFTVPVTIKYDIVLGNDGKTSGTSIFADADDLRSTTAYSGTIVVPPTAGPNGSDSDLSGVIRVWIRGDTKAEKHEKLYVRVQDSGLKNARNNPARTKGGVQEAVVTIWNDDNVDKPIFAISSAEATEGDNIEIKVRRRGNMSASATVKVKLATSASASSNPDNVSRRLATVGEDFTFPAAGKSERFSSGEAEWTIKIPTIATSPNIYEGTEWFYLDISSDDDVAFGRRQAWGRILEASAPLASIASGAVAEEKDGQICFDVSISQAIDNISEVGYATIGGTADYVPKTGTITFPAGALTPSAPPCIQFRDDVKEDGNKTVELAIFETAGAISVPNGRATSVGTIVDDAADASNMRVSVDAGGAAMEGSGGTVVRLTPEGGIITQASAGGVMGLALLSGAGVDVHEYTLEVVPGSAEADTDYKAKSMTIGFLPMGDEVHVPLEVIDDLINEANEDLVVRLTPVSSGDITGGDASFVILDDDPGPVFSVEDVSTSEGNLIAFTVNKTGENETTTSVVYETIDGTAISGEDYVASSGILTFAPGESSKTLVISGVDDAAFELDEAFTLRLSEATGGAAIERTQATASIADNDTGPIFSVTDARGLEGETLEFYVFLDKPSLFEQRVHFNTQDGTAADRSDYQGLSGELVFAPGETEQTVSIATFDDNEDGAGQERDFTVILSDPAGGSRLGDTSGQGVIKDHGVGANSVYFVPAGSSVHISMAGGAGGGDGVGTVAGHGGVGVFELTAQQGFYLRRRAAMQGAADAEYDAIRGDPTGGAAGKPGKAGQGGGASALAISADNHIWIPVAIVGGGGGGGGESDLGGGGGGLGMSGANYETNDRAGQSATISNPGVGGEYSATLAGSGGAPGEDGEVAEDAHNSLASGIPDFLIGGGGAGHNRGSGGGGAGYYGGGGGNNRSPGGGGSGYWNESGWLEIAGVVPTIIENTTGGNAGDGYVIFGEVDSSGADADIPAELDSSGSIAVSSVALTEGNQMMFAVYRETAMEAASIDYFVDLTASVASADDFDGSINGTLTLAAGQRSGLIVISSAEDTVSEGDESFHLRLTLPDPSQGTIFNRVVQGTILDDDLPVSFAVSVDKVTLTEGDKAVVTLVKEQASENTIFLDYQTMASTAVPGADYEELGDTLVFEPNEMAKTILVETVDDNVFGDGGAFSLHLTQDAEGSEVIPAIQFNVLDNEASPQFSATDAKAFEGDPLQFTVQASSASTVDLQIDYAVVDGTALLGQDYDGSIMAVSGSVTLPAGAVVAPVQIATIDDTAPNSPLTLGFAITGVPDGLETKEAEATGTILDNEPPTLGFVEQQASVVPGEVIRFEVNSLHPRDKAYSIDYSTTDGTAVAGVNYVAQTGTLTFAPGDTGKFIYVPTIDTGVPGVGVDFTVSLTSPSGGASIGNDVATGDISWPVGQVIFDTPGSYNWVVPDNVTSVSAVCVGGGGGGGYQNVGQWRSGGGGGLGWRNAISVVPGQTLTVVVGAAGVGPVKSVGQGHGGDSYFKDMETCVGFGGKTGANGQSASYVGDGGGEGGISQERTDGRMGGSGAGGYTGQGGRGSYLEGAAPAEAGYGGAGGGGGDWTGGGGVGLYGMGSSGHGGGQGGSGGGDGSRDSGGNFGGGAAYGNSSTAGGVGAVRIVWGVGRSFPNNAGMDAGVDVPVEPGTGATEPAAGEIIFDAPGTYNWVAPRHVTRVSAVCVGGGGGGGRVIGLGWLSGGGGALAWRNGIAVVPGQGYTVKVGAGGKGYNGNGASSYFVGLSVLLAQGGLSENLSGGITETHGSPGAATFVGDGGGKGGLGKWSTYDWASLGAGGAGGYTGRGGEGIRGRGYPFHGGPGSDGLGGGAGGGGAVSAGNGHGGGGTGLFGLGASGAAGTIGAGAGGGSGGDDGTVGPDGAAYGGGGAYSMSTEGKGGGGACRIIWGDGRSFPYNAGMSQGQ